MDDVSHGLFLVDRNYCVWYTKECTACSADPSKKKDEKNGYLSKRIHTRARKKKKYSAKKKQQDRPGRVPDW